MSLTIERSRVQPPERINIPSDRLNRELEWALTPDAIQIPPSVAVSLAAIIWLLEVDSFRETEEAHMIKGSYKVKMPEHRAAVTQLISKGEHLLYNARLHGLAPTPGEFKIEDLEVTLESLHTTFRCEHQPRNTSETNKEIEAIFAQFDEKSEERGNL